MTTAHLHRVARAVWYVERHLFEPLTADDVARAVGGAVSELHRQFTSVYGVSVMAYVRARRLSEAAERLVTSPTDILELAVQCRYTSQAAFTRAFRRQFGMPPARFRERNPASYRRIRAPDLGALAHRAGLPRAPEPRWLHAPEAYWGMRTRLHAEDTEAYTALARQLRDQVGEVVATGILLTHDGQSFDVFVGVPHPAPPGLGQQATLPAGLYAVFHHHGPAERMRDTLGFVAEALDLDLAAVAHRPHAERFSLAQLDRVDLDVDIWISAGHRHSPHVAP